MMHLVILTAEVPFGSSLFVLFSFLLLMILLKRIAWGPITKMMDERAKKIASELDDAATSREAAKKLQEEQEKEKITAHNQATQLIQDAKKDGQQKGNQIVEQAQARADQISRQASADATKAKNDAINSAKDQVADVSVDIAQAIVGRQLKLADHKALIDDYIKELEQTEVKSN